MTPMHIAIFRNPGTVVLSADVGPFRVWGYRRHGGAPNAVQYDSDRHFRAAH
jgi:hypothetical protein